MIDRPELWTEAGESIWEVASALREALRGPSLDGELLEAIDVYFDTLEQVAHRTRDDDVNPAVSVEIDYVLDRSFPMEAVEEEDGRSALCRALVDLTAILLKTCLTGRLRPSDYWESWRKARGVDRDPTFTEYRYLAKTLCRPIDRGETLEPFGSTLVDRAARILRVGAFDPRPRLQELRYDTALAPADLLNLAVWRLEGLPVEALAETVFTGRGETDTLLCFWAAQDSTCADLFRAWNWIAPEASPSAEGLHEGDAAVAAFHRERGPVDLVRRITASEEGTDVESEVEEGVLEEGSTWVFQQAEELRPEEPARLRSLSETTLASPYCFAPLPVISVGDQQIGKTSFLCALVQRTLPPLGLEVAGRYRVNPGHSLQVLWHDMADTYLRGDPSMTAATSEHRLRFSPSQGRTPIDCELDWLDFPGEYVKPNRYPAEFDERICGARGFAFFFDEKCFDLAGGAPTRRLGELASNYTEMLRRFLEQNPRIRHIPVAIVINKVDRILGDDLARIDSPRLLPPDRDPAWVRLGGEVVDGMLPVERLARLLREHLPCNRTPRIQELIEQLLDGARPLLEAMLDLTFHYEVVLTVSRATPETGFDPGVPLPFGVDAVVAFLAESLLPAFQQGVERELDSDLELLDAFNGSMHTGFGEIEEGLERAGELSAEIGALEERFALLTPFRKSRMKSLKARLDIALKEAGRTLVELYQRIGREAEIPGEDAATGLCELRRKVRALGRSESLLLGWREVLRGRAKATERVS